MKAKIIDMAWYEGVEGEHFLQWRVPCLIHAGNYIVDILHLVKKVLAYGEHFFVIAQIFHVTASIIAYLWLNHCHRAMGRTRGLAQQY